ncbi:hypothetical protein [Nostoc sp. NMS8]|uniref:hypothetical protein n=1 Tax=Nostoc sp. NMS8 TaxID=2815392 RepID=UPI0025E9C409|nr:hypothetical protein [Nostoc sp. NMS8]MBN3959027.1 hypothetical protein [Nostoc sp. NMS8]
MATLSLWYVAATILSLPDFLPLLLMGGTCDRVIANNSDRYSVNYRNATTSVIRTFQAVIDTHVRHQSEASQLLEQLLSAANPLIKSFERK